MASTSTDTDSEPIKSIAFFDIETTGLPDYDFNKTKITELCFVGCTKEQIFETKKYDMPRVLHKLSLCINPFKPISQGSTAISGKAKGIHCIYYFIKQMHLLFYIRS